MAHWATGLQKNSGAFCIFMEFYSKLLKTAKKKDQIQECIIYIHDE